MSGHSPCVLVPLTTGSSRHLYAIVAHRTVGMSRLTVVAAAASAYTRNVPHMYASNKMTRDSIRCGAYAVPVLLSVTAPMVPIGWLCRDWKLRMVPGGSLRSYLQVQLHRSIHNMYRSKYRTHTIVYGKIRLLRKRGAFS